MGLSTMTRNGRNSNLRNGLKEHERRFVIERIVHLTNGERDGLGLRPNFDNLTDKQARRLYDILAKTADADRPRNVNLGALSPSDVREFQKLTAIAAGEAEYFETKAKLEKTRRELAKINKEATKIKVSRREEKGLLFDIAEQLGLNGGEVCLTAPNIGLLFTLLAAFEAGTGIGPGSHVTPTPDGPVFVFDRRFGPLGNNIISDDDYGDWRKQLQHLAANQWFDVTEGSEWTVRLGKRSLDAMGRPS